MDFKFLQSNKQSIVSAIMIEDKPGHMNISSVIMVLSNVFKQYKQQTMWRYIIETIQWFKIHQIFAIILILHVHAPKVHFHSK